MWGRLLIAILVLFGVWYYISQRSASEPTEPRAAQGKPETALVDCFLYADRANAALAAAAALAGRPPVDSMEWFRIESETKSAISSAESACVGSADAAKALVLMQTSLAELTSAAKGGGGATGLAARQGEIDQLLNRAHGR